MLTKKLEQWLDLATAQLRCGAAVQPVRAELETHLQDQYDAYLAQGETCEQAERKTLESMGDAILIGGQLDEVHRPRPAWRPFVLGALVRCVSQVQLDECAWQDILCYEGLRVLLPVGVLAAVSFTDPAAQMRRAWLVYGGALALVMGAILTTQPVQGTHISARYLCSFLILGYAAVLYRQRGREMRGLVTAGAALLTAVLMALCVPAFSVALSLFLAGLVLSLYCGWSNWFGLGRGKSLGVVLAAAFTPGVGILLLPGVATRVMERLNPFFDPTGSGWISLMRLTIWQGRSPLQPVAQQWLDRVPENMFQNMTEQTIFHLLGAEDPLTWSAYAFGRPAALALLAGVAFCLFVLWRAALGTRNASGRLLGVACVSLLTTQLLVSAAFCGGVMVPFLSDGLWNGCTQAVLVGTLLSAVRLDPVKGGQLLSAPGEKVGVWKRLLG